ncbi:MAG: adenylyltransferase/cytidyltransferase family protein [bacterium]|nr:adenylyltransferase/cytidyltransferase family protein [bacterium]
MVEDYKGKTLAVSGGFDPIHVGHLNMFEQAKELVGPSGRLIVFVNSDDFLIKKKGRQFMPLEDRMRLISAMKIVDEVFAVVDKDQSVCETLRKYKPDIFANGGDRNLGNIPEAAVCKELGIKMIFNIGGEKVRSSSRFLEKYSKSEKY